MATSILSAAVLCRAQEAEPIPTESKTRTLDSGVIIEELKLGNGALIELGGWTSLHYKVMTLEGELILDTRTRANPMEYEIFYSPAMMDGWVQGLAGMRVGGMRRVTVPGHLAYRNDPPRHTLLKPGQTVVFEFECMSVTTWPNPALSNGMKLRRLRDGKGHAAKYGDWVSFHIKVFAGEGETYRAGLDSQAKASEPIQVALPCPNGVFTGSSAGFRYNIPYLDMLLYGIKDGERRDATFPTSRMIGPMGDPRLGIRADEPFSIEIECVGIESGTEITLQNGILIQDLTVGNGRYAHMGEYAVFYARGTLEDGTLVESNWDDDEPAKIRLYHSNVVSGFRFGIQGMRVGGVRRLTIPPSMAFGSSPPDSFSHVPPNATLYYEIRLLDVVFPQNAP
ncbi:MAG: FKBP-type peptidyl-prolyl cis-trans isomerase [Planctomycetota bacterium]|nr:FKBP-type peptidyl-prolyl cis-trans isomerase [Planctomycetota bacterium]